MKEIEVNVITLENDQDYIILDTITCNDSNYIFLVNENDDLDKCIRKVIKKDGKDYLVKLDSNDEFDEVIFAYKERFKKGDE